MSINHFTILRECEFLVFFFFFKTNFICQGSSVLCSTLCFECVHHSNGQYSTWWLCNRLVAHLNQQFKCHRSLNNWEEGRGLSDQVYFGGIYCIFRAKTAELSQLAILGFKFSFYLIYLTLTYLAACKTIKFQNSLFWATFAYLTYQRALKENPHRKITCKLHVNRDPTLDAGLRTLALQINKANPVPPSANNVCLWFPEHDFWIPSQLCKLE